MAAWCPDIKKHLEPLSEQTARNVGQLFGLPAWQLSYWACMAGPIPLGLKTEALGWPVGRFFEALEEHLALEPQQSRLAAGGDQYVPAPGIADLVGKARGDRPRAAAAREEAGPTSSSPRKRGARPGAAAAAAPGGAAGEKAARGRPAKEWGARPGAAAAAAPGGAAGKKAARGRPAKKWDARPGAAAAAAPGGAAGKKAARGRPAKKWDARPGAAAAAAPGGAEPGAAHAEPVASPGCSPALYHHYSSSPVQYRQYYVTSNNVIIIISSALDHQYFTHCVESALGFACGKGLMYAAFPGRLPGRRRRVPQPLLGDTGQLPCLATQLPVMGGSSRMAPSSGRPPHCRTGEKKGWAALGGAALG